PHPEYHHIKKENIGLIEVMGLAVLPARLKTEMEVLKDAMVNGNDIEADERIAKHKEWAERIIAENEITEENCAEILRQEIGKVFTAILEQCGVFERSEKGKEQFIRFAATV
ncbi:MAG: galactose-1-phosphate uridylyltransferase, partial [Ruminococcaceae bacterium]|nr:galactose-1-phosphate uridylyltransferase [Oscillospiraceae bacterium]